MGRPRIHHLPDGEILAAFRDGATISALARTHGVDRVVIRRVLTDARERGENVLDFPGRPVRSVSPDGRLTTLELVQRTGLTRDQSQYWPVLGLLYSERVTTRENGLTRLFDVTEVAVARLMVALVADGMKPRAAARIARELAETGTSSIAGIRVDLPESEA